MAFFGLGWVPKAGQLLKGGSTSAARGSGNAMLKMSPKTRAILARRPRSAPALDKLSSFRTLGSAASAIPGILLLQVLTGYETGDVTTVSGKDATLDVLMHGRTIRVAGPGTFFGAERNADLSSDGHDVYTIKRPGSDQRVVVAERIGDGWLIADSISEGWDPSAPAAEPLDNNLEKGSGPKLVARKTAGGDDGDTETDTSEWIVMPVTEWREEEDGWWVEYKDNRQTGTKQRDRPAGAGTGLHLSGVGFRLHKYVAPSGVTFDARIDEDGVLRLIPEGGTPMSPEDADAFYRSAHSLVTALEDYGVSRVEIGSPDERMADASNPYRWTAHIFQDGANHEVSSVTLMRPEGMTGEPGAEWEVSPQGDPPRAGVSDSYGPYFDHWLFRGGELVEYGPLQHPKEGGLETLHDGVVRVYPLPGRPDWQILTAQRPTSADAVALPPGFSAYWNDRPKHTQMMQATFGGSEGTLIIAPDAPAAGSNAPASARVHVLPSHSVALHRGFLASPTPPQGADYVDFHALDAAEQRAMLGVYRQMVRLVHSMPDAPNEWKFSFVTDATPAAGELTVRRATKTEPARVYWRPIGFVAR